MIAIKFRLRFTEPIEDLPLRRTWLRSSRWISRLWYPCLPARLLVRG